jgi:hypothetical protein
MVTIDFKTFSYWTQLDRQTFAVLPRNISNTPLKDNLTAINPHDTRASVLQPIRQPPTDDRVN